MHTKTARALIKTAEYYMPVKLSTYSNFFVTVARVYYKAITNRNLFALLNMVALRAEGAVKRQGRRGGRGL